jgi:small subunit ribosomal protein S17
MPFAAKPTNLLGSFLTPKITSQKVGVVVSAGKMAKAVKVRIAGQEWNKHIRKVNHVKRAFRTHLG